MPIVSALIVAMATPSQGAPQQQGNFLLLMIPYALIFVVFYFLMIRPTRQRQHAQLLEALKPGDKVVCAGGIRATVVGVTDTTVQVKIADQVRIDVEKASITTVMRSE